MERGAWWATAHGVTKSWTPISTRARAHTHTHTHTHPRKRRKAMTLPGLSGDQPATLSAHIISALCSE